MSKSNFIKIIFFLCILFFAKNTQSQNLKNKSSQSFFIENKGQILDQKGKHNTNVLYLLNTTGLNVQLRQNGFSYDVYEKKKLSPKKADVHKTHFNSNKFNKKNDFILKEALFHRVDIDFIGISNDLIIKTFDISKSYTNYYNIPGKEEGITNVKSFKKIVYQNLYKGIDVEFFVPENIKKPIEYNFIIKPEGDISNIKMKISGAEVSLENNSLKMNLIHGNLNEIIPNSWIQNNGKNEEVIINYVKKGKNIFGFKANNKNYKKSSVLVIDPTPVREWGTYFGDYGSDTARNKSMTGDSQGNTIHAGFTNSFDNIATVGSHQYENYILSSIQSAGFLMKFDNNGMLHWSTYYGGVLPTEFYNVITDKEDNIIGVGLTYSDLNIATPNSHQEFKGGDSNDGFLVKFNSNGERIWSSYYGGIGQDIITSVSTDNLNNIYIAGATGSGNNMISANAFDAEYENNNSNYASEAFIAKFDQNGNREWGTYYGGASNDVITSIEIGNDTNLYIVGYTRSENNIATPGAYKEILTMNGPQTSDRLDTFIAKFNANGQRIWGTYFGGDAIDWGYDLAIDNENNVIVSGATQSTIDIAFNNSHQVNKGGDIADWDNFLAKFTENGSLLWSSYYGGEEREDYTHALVDTDNENNIYLGGGTYSQTNIATTNSYQETRIGSSNAYFVKFDKLGNRLWGTYYGANHTTTTGLYVSDGSIYIAGETNSLTEIASSGTHQPELNSNIHGNHKVDYFVAKFIECESTIITEVNEFLCSGEDISFNASGGITYSWSGPNGFMSTEQNPVIQNANFSNSGTYSVYIESASGCNDTRSFDILVSERPNANPINNIEACEDTYDAKISSSFDTSDIELQVLGSQTGMVISYLGSNGNALPSPLPNPMTNSITNLESITVRVSNDNNLECYAETSFNLIVNPLPTINVIDDIYSCDDDYDGITVFDVSHIEANLLGAQEGMIVEYFYENGQQLPSPLPNTIYNIIIQETITARITNPSTDCFNETTFNLIVNSLPIANILEEIIGCDDNIDGVSEYFDTSNVESTVLGGQTGMEVSYYDNMGDFLSNTLTNPYTNIIPDEEIITVRVTNTQTSCYAETSLVLKTSVKPQINTPQDIYSCDEGNGISTFDLSTIENEIIGNQRGLDVYYYDIIGNELTSMINSSFQNIEPWGQTIYVKVENASNNLCFSEISFNLLINELPQLEIEESYFLCNLEPSLPLSIEGNFDSWEWAFEDGSIVSNSSIVNLSNAGNYSLTVSESEIGITCKNIFYFELIRSVLPTITNVEYQELSDNNYIKIIASGDGDFEYSIDGINYQNSNEFNNILGGVYNVIVRDKYGCGEDTQQITIVDYPKYFTPNGDGTNDYWQIKGITNYISSEIYIYDRYGKLLKQLNTNSEGWDGTFNGSMLASDDFWFSVILENGREFKGHFTLKR